MRITSWSIIFVLIVFAFSFSNRMLANNKMEIVKEEVRYNNALDLSTMDATTSLMENMINLGDETNETFYTVLSSVDRFFDSFSLTLGYYGGEEKQTALKTYIPVVAVLANEGVYMCSLENLQKNEGGYTYNYAEHTVKPKIPYAVEDKTPMLTKTVLGADKIAMPPAGVYINYTMGNMIKVYDPKTKEILQGSVVDTRHYKDITEDKNVTQKEILSDGTEVNFKIIVEDDVYSKEGEYKGQTIYYEKTFYYINGVRYLYEEWYIEDELVDRRSTEYTEDAYNFTKRLETVGKVGSDKNYYELEGNYLTQGNPENTGKTDPFTGIYTIGEYNRVKNEAITEVVKEQLSTYTVLHNRYLEMQNITYTFALPDIDSQDWERAINDVSVFAFVQGIPLVGEQYYNNYGIAGAQIVDREIYYGWPGERYELTSTGIRPGDEDFPVYYSSYSIPQGSHYLLEANGARIYYSAQAAAMEGYFPNIHSNSFVDELELDVAKLAVELYYRGNTTAFEANPNNNQTGQFGATGTTTYDPIILTYLVNPGSENIIYLNQAKYMYSENISMNYSKNRILNAGTLIGLATYNPVSRVGTFEVDKNGTYMMAAREYGGTSGKSNKVTINAIESGFFYTDVSVQVGYNTRDPKTGRRYAKVTLVGNGTPIFSSITYQRTDGKDVNSLDDIIPTTQNVAYGDKPKGYIYIYDSGQYKIDTANGYGDKTDSDTVNIAIPNLPPIVQLSMNPTEKTTKGSKAKDDVTGLTATKYTETYLYKQGSENLTVKAVFGDEDVVKEYTKVVDPYTAVWTHYYKSSSTSAWKNLGTLNVGNTNQYTTKEFDVGTHRVYVTATDIYGASTTSYIEFIVAEYIDTVNLKDWYVYDHYQSQSTYNSSGRVNSPYNRCGDYGFYLPYHITTGTSANGQNWVKFIGYPAQPYLDYLIYPSNLSGTRLINFTLRANQFYPHTLVRAGVYINATNTVNKGYRLDYYCSSQNTMNRLVLVNLSNGQQVASINFSSWAAVMNIEIEITQTKVTVRQKKSTDSSYTTVLTANLTATGANGFGPYAQYSSHGCPEQSSIIFENIRMTRISN